MFSSTPSAIERFFLIAPLGVLPLLTSTARLDLLDLHKAQQKAVVGNRLGGESTLLHLEADSLLLQSSSLSTWGLRVLPDSNLRVTYTVLSPDTLISVQHFNKNWQLKR